MSTQPILPEAEGADRPGQLPPGVRHPPWLLAAAGAVAVAVLILVILGWTIDRGHQFQFDRAIMLAMRRAADPLVPIGPTWLKPAMIGTTALGGGIVLTGVVALTALFLLVKRLWLTAGLVLLATISGSWAVSFAKAAIARPRPALIDHLVEVSSASFPSGHSANSAIIYLTIATLLTQVIRGRVQRAMLFLIAALLVAAIGCSRVYLGVHWPSDVLAGWSFGTLWALAWWAIAAWIRLKRAGQSLPVGG